MGGYTRILLVGKKKHNINYHRPSHLSNPTINTKNYPQLTRSLASIWQVLQRLEGIHRSEEPVSNKQVICCGGVPTSSCATSACVRVMLRSSCFLNMVDVRWVWEGNKSWQPNGKHGEWLWDDGIKNTIYNIWQNARVSSVQDQFQDCSLKF